MDTPGNVLKTERERQKKPLKDVARKLKINIKYLEAIEDDDYDVLPAEVFARSYIRLYADELDLDSTKLLALFEDIGKTPSAEEPEPQVQETAPPLSAASQKNISKMLLVFVAAGVLILIFFFVSQNKEQPHEDPGETALHETEKAAIDQEAPPAAVVPAAKMDHSEDRRPVVKPEQVSVTDEEKSVVKEAPAQQKEEPAAEQAPVPVKQKPVVKPEQASVTDEEKPVVKEAPAQQKEKPAAEQAPVPVKQKPVVKPEQVSVTDEEKPVVKEAPAQQKEEPAAEQAPVPVKQKPVEKAPVPVTVYEKRAGEMTLQIVATELTWVSLSIDGAKPREWHLRPGETMTLKGQNGFRGKVGNAGGTILYFNNEDLGELGPPGTIIDIALPR